MARAVIPLPDTPEFRFARAIARAVPAGVKVYVNGGAVRDSLMNQLLDLEKPRIYKDVDLSITAPPSVTKNLGFKAVPTGEQYGTITLIRDDCKIEVTTTRSDHGHGENRKDVKPEFIFDPENGPKMDVERRDFTINGLLWDPDTGEVIDYVGGIEDIKNRVVRYIGEDPDVRVIEDGLRALRWARIICSTGFAPHPSGFSVTSNPVVQNRIKNLSGERVRDEFLGILSTERPAMGMTLLQDLGILEVWFPELEALVGLEQNIWHSEDVWGHTLMALHYAALLGGDLTDRVTAVFHDVGKGVTQHVKSKGLHSDDDVERQLREYGYSFHDHDSEGIRVLDASTIPRLKLYGSTDKYEVDMERVKHLINGHMHVFSSDKIRRGKRLKFLGVSDFGIDMLERSFILFLADTLARNLWLDYPLGRDEAEPMWGVVERGAQIRQDVLRYLNNTDAAPSVKDVNLSGHDVMALLSIKPSPTVGVVLRHLFYLVTNEDIANDKDALSDYVTRNKELLLNLQEEK